MNRRRRAGRIGAMKSSAGMIDRIDETNGLLCTETRLVDPPLDWEIPEVEINYLLNVRRAPRIKVEGRQR